MNPDEELEPEVAPRAYYHQPVWKRIVVIAAGPAVNLLIAFVILFFLAFERRRADRARSRGSSPARRRPRCSSRATSWSRSTASAASSSELRDQIATHECAGEQTDGCRRRDAGRARRSIRDGREITVEPVRPEYDDEAERPLLGFAYGTQPLDPGARRRGASGRCDRMWDVTTQTVSIIARIFDAEQREQISGVVGSYEVTRQSIEFDTRQALFVLALISLSLAVINLFPFLPLDGGHIFWSLVEKVRGQPVAVRDHGARLGGRLRAGDGAVRDRPLQRHRPAHRRGLRRARR